MIRDKGDDAIPQVEFDVEADDAIQAKRRKLFGTPTSGSQIEYSRALAYVEAMSILPREDMTEGVFNRYIDALTVIGDYAQAYSLTKDSTYNAIDKAIQGKTKKCKCKGVTQTVLENGRPKTTQFASQFVKKRVYDIVKQKHVDLMCCNQCLNLYAA